MFIVFYNKMYHDNHQEGHPHTLSIGKKLPFFSIRKLIKINYM